MPRPGDAGCDIHHKIAHFRREALVHSGGKRTIGHRYYADGGAPGDDGNMSLIRKLFAV